MTDSSVIPGATVGLLNHTEERALKMSVTYKHYVTYINILCKSHDFTQNAIFRRDFSSSFL